VSAQRGRALPKLISDDQSDAAQRGLATMALLLGAVTLARLAETPELASKILDSANQGRRLFEKHW
jgi:TetR/AcrR family transcriptional repressor of nem operon